MKTPLLVSLPPTFAQYLETATKRCRYEYRQAPAINHAEVHFDLAQVRYWMQLWEKQPIATGFPKWRRYTPERFENLAKMGILRVFTCDHALQMVEKCDDYIYCHPPLYDKQNQLAKAMWFALIRWACGKANWLDLGGGGQPKRWSDLNRDSHYKWLYVSKTVAAQPWRVQVCPCGWRELISEPHPCSRCAR